MDMETQPSHDQTCYQVSTAMTRLLRLIEQSLGKLTEQFYLTTSWKNAGRKSSMVLAMSLNDWISILTNGGGAKKRFQYCLNPNSSSHSVYLRAIQGHSGDNASDPELQDNVFLPEGFTECIFHVGNASGMNCTIRCGLIPGGRSLKRGRQSVFYTTVNPMADDNGMRETPRNLRNQGSCHTRILGNLF